MACSGGTQERNRHVLIPIRGLGRCPKAGSPLREQTRVCNAQPCMGDEFCVAKQDLIIAIDSSGSLKEDGANAIRDFAEVLVGRFLGRYYGDSTMKVGVIQFGNGQILADGTTEPATPVLGLTSDMDHVKESIRALKWAKGFTNMAQAFTLADTMLQRGGRSSSQSAVLVITDCEPSFVFQTRQKANALKAKNVKLFFAAVSKFKGKSYGLMKEFASSPWETHLVRIPGLPNLQADPDIFAQQCVARFCPNAISPSAMGSQEQGQGFFLVRMNGRCGKHGRELGKDVQDPQQCKMLARQHGAVMFSFGKGGLRQGHCVAEDMMDEELRPMKKIQGEKYCKPWTAQYGQAGHSNDVECAAACLKTPWCSAANWFRGWEDECYFFKSCDTWGTSQYHGILHINPTTQKKMQVIRTWPSNRVTPTCPLGDWEDDSFYDLYALNSLTEDA